MEPAQAKKMAQDLPASTMAYDASHKSLARRASSGVAKSELYIISCILCPKPRGSRGHAVRRHHLQRARLPSPSCLDQHTHKNQIKPTKRIENSTKKVVGVQARVGVQAAKARKRQG